MERFCAYPSQLPALSAPAPSLPPPLPPLSPAPLAAPSSVSGGSVASTMLGKLVSVILTFIFAMVGSLIGAMTGAFVGQATESGFFRGAGIGAISGAVFSMEVLESSLHLWRSDESGFWSLLYMIDIFSSLLSGRLVREQVGPVMLSAVQSQMRSVETNSEEIVDIFSTGGTKGLSADSLEKLPKITITKTNCLDATGEKMTCSVCLQDFQLGESVRCLPLCQHIFHLSCIDSWLTRHGSCPLCRRDL
ncbi:hypothetical protein H6P81_018727 [Aristolochia fimbriata]|uniref:RING-type domain-containing protein n=1 Tax=Aristolochia fimbriata TaxID=158543 RepID=A0AAV7E2S2_ARIFI|nr:hypothetical protein H6P81_018727 [Aristolochia fimbriata]